MKIDITERTDLITFIVDLAKDTDMKNVAKLAVYTNMLEKHQHNDADIKVVHKGLRDFIVEVRECNLG